MFGRYDDIMSVADVANALHVDRHTIYSLINQGKLHEIPPTGRGRKITKQSLINYVAKN